MLVNLYRSYQLRIGMMGLGELVSARPFLVDIFEGNDGFAGSFSRETVLDLWIVKMVGRCYSILL